MPCLASSKVVKSTLVEGIKSNTSLIIPHIKYTGNQKTNTNTINEPINEPNLDKTVPLFVIKKNEEIKKGNLYADMFTTTLSRIDCPKKQRSEANIDCPYLPFWV